MTDDTQPKRVAVPIKIPSNNYITATSIRQPNKRKSDDVLGGPFNQRNEKKESMLNTVMGSVPSKSKIVHNLQPQTMVKRPLEFYGTEVGASNEQSFSRCPPVGSELNAKTVHGSSNLYRQGSFRKSLIPASAPFGQVSKYFSPNSSGMKPIRKSDVVNISDDDADSVEVNLPSKEVKVHFSKPLLHPTDRVVFKIALFWLANALVSRNGNAAFTKESITIQKQNNEIFTYRGPSISGKPMVLEIGTVQISETKKHVLICFHGKSSLRVEEIAVLFHEEQEFHHVQSLLNPIFTLVQVSDDKLAKFVRESEKFLTSTQRTRYSKIHNDDSSEEFRPTDSATVKEGDWQERRKSRRISQHAVKTSGFYQEKQSSTQIESPPTIPRPNTNNELFQYPPNDRFSVSIKEHDEHRLNEGEFLNDTIIEFYLRYLRDPSTKVLESANLKAAYFYNSFFYNQFQRKDSERPSILIRKKDDEGKSVDPFEFGFGKIKSWTAKVNIFDYKYLIVPINESLHWYLAIIHNPGALLDDFDELEQKSLVQIPTVELESDPEVLPHTRNENDINNNPATILDSQVSIDLDLHEPNHDIGLDQLAAKTSAELFQESPVVDQCDGKQIQMVDVSFVNPNKEAEIEELGKEFLNHLEEVEDELLEYIFKMKAPESQTGESKEITVISDEEGLSVVNPVRKKKKQTNKSSPKKRFDFKNETKWYQLLTSCHIMILDSLGLHRLRTISSLKKYLVMEAKHKLNIDISEKKITGIHVKAPLQPNHCDCGVYVLHNIETFLKNPNKYLQYCLERQTGTLDWYSTDEIPKKRIMMKKLVQELSKAAEETGEQKNAVNLDDHSDCEIIE